MTSCSHTKSRLTAQQSWCKLTLMNDLVLPKGANEIVGELFQKYRTELVEATTATENAVRQLRQQLTSMERNQVAIMAQKALIDTFEKDFTTKVNENATTTTGA